MQNSKKYRRALHRSVYFTSILQILILPARISGEPADEPIQVFVDQAKQNMIDQKVSTPLNATDITLRITPPSLRSRYKLENLNSSWKERTGEMRFIIRFIDKEGSMINLVVFPATGKSPGWKNSAQTSKYSFRSELVFAPPEAHFLSVALSSGGPSATVGTMLITDISVSEIASDGTAGTPLITKNSDRNDAQISWNKAGSHPAMATLIKPTNGPNSSPILQITDDNLNAHADLATERIPLPNKQRSFLVEWKEVYSIGLAGDFDLDYERLPSGNYRFVIEELTLDGSPTGKTNSLDLYVPGPYWRKWWFWLGCISLISSIAILWGRSIVQRKINRHIRHAQLLSEERLRIARDLHDDLGTRLSHISLIGSHAQSSATDAESRSSFKQITELSGELVNALSETVWVLNSNNNDLESLVNFLCRLASELCRLADFRCRIDAMRITEDREISHEFRHNFTLAVKESVHNSLRHSEGTEIQLKISFERENLVISVIDNGIGMDEESRKGGNGLTNIKDRMQSIGGTCSVTTLESSGVRVLLTAPLKK